MDILIKRFAYFSSRFAFRLALVWVATSFFLHSRANASTVAQFTVTSAESSRSTVGTLNWAVFQANYYGADLNYINFNIPRTTGEIEIVLSETLYIARPMIINAATEPGYAGQPLIRINCNMFDSGFNLVGVVAGVPPLSNGDPSTGGGSTIRGFRIVYYNSNGITISRGGDATLIANNQIGFAPLPGGGTFRNVTVSAQCRGIGIASNFNVIRGNTISGVGNGITLGDASGGVVRNNSFEGNFIGTDPTGTSKIGNDSDGIYLGTGAQQNLIGPGNVLSGMDSTGVELLEPSATDNVIFGNMIGLNVAGTDVIPNGELGVLIANGAANNWVGGPYGGAYAGNVISGNGFGAVAIGTSAFPGIDGTNNNHVEGNLIGTDSAGTGTLGTQVSGVTVQDNSKGNIVRKNVIVGQMNHGVVFAGATNNAMYGNWIGVTSRGQMIANAAFGVYILDASNNTVQLSAAMAGPGTEQNIFGLNTLGPFGVNGSSSGNVIDQGPAPTPAAAATRLLNISTRMNVETGNNVLIAGFIITGNSQKKVIIRGIGPSLGVAGALADPTLELNMSGGSVFNDNWRSDQEQEVIASGIPPSSNLESAIVATLQPGAYTAIMRGKSTTTGVGLVEVYDLDSSAPAELANISTRGIVRNGANVMIAGFILGESSAESRVVVRVRGRSLAAAGVSTPLDDPTLHLFDGNGTRIRENNDWQDDPVQAAELTTIGLPLPDEFEAAIVTLLPPAAYTAVVSDKNQTSGIGLVEVYNVP